MLHRRRQRGYAAGLALLLTAMVGALMAPYFWFEQQTRADHLRRLDKQIARMLKGPAPTASAPAASAPEAVASIQF